MRNADGRRFKLWLIRAELADGSYRIFKVRGVTWRDAEEEAMLREYRAVAVKLLSRNPVRILFAPWDSKEAVQ